MIFSRSSCLFSVPWISPDVCNVNGKNLETLHISQNNKTLRKSRIHLRLFRLPVLISLEYLEWNLLEAGDCAYDTNDEDNCDQSEGHLHMSTQHNTERSGVPIDSAQTVTHEASQARHYGECA